MSLYNFKVSKSRVNTIKAHFSTIQRNWFIEDKYQLIIWFHCGCHSFIVAELSSDWMEARDPIATCIMNISVSKVSQGSNRKYILTGSCRFYSFSIETAEWLNLYTEYNLSHARVVAFLVLFLFAALFFQGLYSLELTNSHVNVYVLLNGDVLMFFFFFRTESYKFLTFVNTHFTSARFIPNWGGGRFLCPAGLFLWGAGAIMTGCSLLSDLNPGLRVTTSVF